MGTEVIWAVVILIIALAFFVIVLFLKGLIDRLITLVENLNDKITSIEGEIKPILMDVEKTLSNVEPLTRELGEKSADLGNLLSNVEKVTDDLQATTGAVRNGIVPIAHTITSVFSGIMEGVKTFTEPDRKQRYKLDNDGGDEI